MPPLNVLTRSPFALFLRTLVTATAGLVLLSACASRSPTAAACEGYCTTYDEGYYWAQRANLLEGKSCSGYSSAFAEGCLQAVSDSVLSANPQRAY